MRPVSFRLALAGFLPVLAAALFQAVDRGVPASRGIPNFGQVSDHLFRGAQPNAAGLASLKQLGVKTIICLRMTNDLWGPEKALAASNGMTFINLPLPGASRPPDGEVAARFPSLKMPQARSMCIAATGARRLKNVFRSWSTSGSAFSWMVSDAEVCCTKSVSSPWLTACRPSH